MISVNEIDVQKVRELKENGSTTIVDIRDLQSFKAGHIPNSIHLNDSTVEQFISCNDKEKKLIVYCYHGISSQGAAAYFSEQGFKNVSSMVGGFEVWQNIFPDNIDTE